MTNTNTHSTYNQVAAKISELVNNSNGLLDSDSDEKHGTHYIWVYGLDTNPADVQDWTAHDLTDEQVELIKSFAKMDSRISVAEQKDENGYRQIGLGFYFEDFSKEELK